MTLRQIHIGDRLKWTDPEYPDREPIPVVVVRKQCDVVGCVYADDRGEVEAFAHELSK